MVQKENKNLFLTITGLEDEISFLNAKHESMPDSTDDEQQFIYVLGDDLEEYIRVVGFDYSPMKKKIKITSRKKTEFQKVDHMPQHRA